MEIQRQRDLQLLQPLTLEIKHFKDFKPVQLEKRREREARRRQALEQRRAAQQLN